jgi:hypothetical protein
MPPRTTVLGETVSISISSDVLAMEQVYILSLGGAGMRTQRKLGLMVSRPPTHVKRSSVRRAVRTRRKPDAQRAKHEVPVAIVRLHAGCMPAGSGGRAHCVLAQLPWKTAGEEAGSVSRHSKNPSLEDVDHDCNPVVHIPSVTPTGLALDVPFRHLPR